MKYTFLTMLYLCCTYIQTFAQSEQEVQDYIEKYKSLAMEEQVRVGVPASITLAQGLHESAVGKSMLATNGNNHFGIKCKSNWMGDTIRHDDDKKQECFRKYISAEQSYIDHSDFLKGSNRYSFLFDLEITDYIGWASGLKRAGYATNPLYVRRLTDLVEKYNLQQYTYEALKKKFATPAEIVPNNDATININQKEDPNNNYKGLKGFWASKDDLLTDKAVSLGIRYKHLLEYNDLPDAPLVQDMFLFTEKKRKTGTVEFHLVQTGETMHFISQKEAIQLNQLYAFNNMTEGQEPEVGEQLSLQYKSYNTPRIRPQTTTTEVKQQESQTTLQEVKQQEVEKKVAESEVSTETKVISNPAILDLEKARKTEALLGNGKLEEKIEVKTQEPKATEKLVNVQYGSALAPEKKIEESKPIATPEPKKEKQKAPKRTYNEPNVSESVKVLKEKFDEIVYTPLPEKKIVADTTNKVVATTPKPESKTESQTNAAIKKENTTKKTELKKETIVNDPKSSKVEKTSTGIVRDLKKVETKPEAKSSNDKKTNTDAKQKTNIKTTKKEEVKKEETKIANKKSKEPLKKEDKKKPTSSTKKK